MNANQLILLALLLAAVGLVAYKLASLLVIRNLKHKKIEIEKFLEDKISVGPADLCFPVRYASKNHFVNHFTFLPWEAQGVLVLNDTHFVYSGISREGVEQELRFPKNDCLLIYIERANFRDCGLSWFSLEDQLGNKHYFCSQNKLPDLTTEFGTTALYEKMSDNYSNLY